MVALTKNFGLIHEPAEAYHAKAGEYLSSHLLGDFRQCPALYHRKVSGLIPDKDRPAYLIGRAAHTLILEGLTQFEEEYAVGGPINPKTGQPFGANTKAFAEWAEAQGKQVLTHDQADLVMQMNHAVQVHKGASTLFAYGEAEGVVRVDYCGVPCQIRMDFLNPSEGIVDLKTCDDLTWFEADARRYGYAHQLAFYRAVLAQHVGMLMPVHLVAVEKKEPFRVGLFVVDPQVLAQAQTENEAAIRRLLGCRERGTWPTGYEETRIFDFIS